MTDHPEDIPIPKEEQEFGKLPNPGENDGPVFASEVDPPSAEVRLSILEQKVALLLAHVDVPGS